MTRFLLVRHAAHDNVGVFLAGRKPIRLGPDGLAQAERLAERLATETVDAIFCSPSERTQQTAGPIAQRLGLQVGVEDALNEVDFGDWSGHTFADLNADPRWRRWNSVRSLASTPGGETMRSVQGRIVGFMERWYQQGPVNLLLITHADVIKAAVAYHLGLCLDDWGRLSIEPASITSLLIGEYGATLYSLNEVVH